MVEGSTICYAFLRRSSTHVCTDAINSVMIAKCFLHLGDSRGRCPHENQQVSALSEH